MSNRRDVPIEVTSRHEPVSDTMKSHAVEKVSKLLRFHTRISRIQVVVDGVHGQPAMEMIVHVDSGRTLVAKGQHEHFRGGLDRLVDRMERQLKRDNEKRKDHHKAEPGSHEPADSGGEEETFDDGVRRELDS